MVTTETYLVCRSLLLDMSDDTCHLFTLTYWCLYQESVQVDKAAELFNKEKADSILKSITLIFCLCAHTCLLFKGLLPALDESLYAQYYSHFLVISC